MNSLDYPEYVSDERTIRLFRERIANNHNDKKIWKSVWKQFNENGITVEKGTIQDATLFESNPGHGKTRKGDWTIPVAPEFPERPPDQENPEAGMSE